MFLTLFENTVKKKIYTGSNGGTVEKYKLLIKACDQTLS